MINIGWEVFIAEACTRLLWDGAHTSYTIKGFPKNESEWEASYQEQVDVVDGINIMSADKSKWTLKWVDIEAKAKELVNVVPLEQLRHQRAKLLEQCDWVVTRATDTSTPIPTEWKNYRQALRDITSTITDAATRQAMANDFKHSSWPTKPS